MSKTPTDLGIPLLTEVIAPPEPEIEQLSVPVDNFVPSAAPAIPVTAQTAQQDPAAEPAPPIDGWLDEEWTRLEQKIRDRVLTQLQERVDTMIDQRIREGVADVLQNGLTRLIDELRLSLEQTLDEVVTDAVSREIERTRFTKN
jgi:hypothetical protein